MSCNYISALFRNCLWKIDWETIICSQTESANNVATSFRGIFEFVLDDHVPLRKRLVDKVSGP